MQKIGASSDWSSGYGERQKTTGNRLKQEDVQSSQVRCAFWQWKQARFAFFFFGPSLDLREGALLSWSVESSAVSERLRLLALSGGDFFFCARVEAASPPRVWAYAGGVAVWGCRCAGGTE